VADPNLRDDQWLELYRYLLERLDFHGYSDVRREIELIATAPVFEEGTIEEQETISKEFRTEIGTRIVRRREPREVFKAALDVLWTRMFELPEIALSIAKKLDVHNQQIEFRVDYEERYAPKLSESVSLRRLMLEESEKRLLQQAFDALGVECERQGGE
jgi:hypothetical protein